MKNGLRKKLKFTNVGLALITLGTLFYFDNVTGVWGWPAFFVLLFLGILDEVGSFEDALTVIYLRASKSKFLVILFGTVVSEVIESKITKDPLEADDLLVALAVSTLIDFTITKIDRRIPRDHPERSL